MNMVRIPIAWMVDGYALVRPEAVMSIETFELTLTPRKLCARICLASGHQIHSSQTVDQIAKLLGDRAPA